MAWEWGQAEPPGAGVGSGVVGCSEGAAAGAFLTLLPYNIDLGDLRGL